MKKNIMFIFVLIVVIGCSTPPPTDTVPPKQQIIAEAPIVEITSLESNVTVTNDTEISPPQPLIIEEPLTFEEQVWKQRIDAALAPSFCPPVTKVEYPNSYYQGPLIDTHYHIPHLPELLPEDEEEEELYRQYYGRAPVVDDDDQNEEDDLEPVLGRNVKISDIVCTFRHEGTTKNFALFPVFPELSHQAQVEVVKRTMEQYRDLFTPFIDSPEPDDIRPTVEAKVLSEMLASSPGLFQGWGEIGLYEQENGLNDFPPDLPLFTEIYPLIRENKMMIWMHPGENQKDNFERVLKQNPDIPFIVHGDQIKDDIDDLLGKYPNIYFCINNFYANQDLFFSYKEKIAKTKESFFAALENYEPLIQADLRAWKSLIEAHPDQVMWCLDRDENVLWTFDRDVGVKLVNYARAFIGRLNPAVQNKFAYKNAERLINEG